jgi:hypothetical protein
MKSFAAIRTLDCLTRRQGIHIPIKKKVIAGFPSQAPSMGWVVICRKSEMGVVDHIIFSFNFSSEGRDMEKMIHTTKNSFQNLQHKRRKILDQPYCIRIETSLKKDVSYSLKTFKEIPDIFCSFLYFQEFLLTLRDTSCTANYNIMTLICPNKIGK